MSKRARLAALGAALPLLFGGYAALAAVSGIPVASANGNAGYDAVTTDPAGATAVQGIVTGGQYGLTVDGGAHGVQLCNTTTNFGAQLGLLSDNLKTTYHVASGTGTIPAPGCPVGGVLPSPVDFPALSAVPYGHRVWLDINLVKKARHVIVLICLPLKHETDTAEPLAPDQAPPVGLTPRPGLYGGFRCFVKKLTFTVDKVVFRAQDLDAPTATPVAGDLPGVQVRYVRVPHHTVFTDAGAGINENLTKLVACSGNGFPETLAGPAAYVSAACQPVSAFDHVTAAIAGGPAQPLSALTTTEGVSPGSTTATPALVAPDNTLALTPGSVPPGTATDASTGGDSFTMFSANAPTS